MIRDNGPHVRDPKFWRVAAHEIGHGLGLGHDDDPDSIMTPVWSDAEPRIAPRDVIAYVNAWCPSKQ